MFYIRTLMSLSMIGIVYYVGKQMRRSELVQKEMHVWRQHNTQKKPKEHQSDSD